MSPLAAVARTGGRIALSWLLAVAATFLLLRLMPGDPVTIFLANMGVGGGAETAAAYRAQWGLDQGLAAQFARWLAGFVRLDWGLSFETGRPIVEDFAHRVPWSAAIGFGGLGLAVAFGLSLGFFAALTPDGLADRISRAMAVAGQALPAFAVGLLLIWVFGVQLRWIAPFGGGPVERLLLPVLLVALFSTGSIARLVRAGFAEVRQSPYHRTALAKGLSRLAALWRHGRGAATLTLIAGLAPEMAWIVGGTAVAEIVFGVPGLSERVVQAVAHRDYGVLQAYVALIAFWVAVTLQGAGALRRALDPRAA